MLNKIISLIFFFMKNAPTPLIINKMSPQRLTDSDSLTGVRGIFPDIVLLLTAAFGPPQSGRGILSTGRPLYSISRPPQRGTAAGRLRRAGRKATEAGAAATGYRRERWKTKSRMETKRAAAEGVKGSPAGGGRNEEGFRKFKKKIFPAASGVLSGHTAALQSGAEREEGEREKTQKKR